MVRGNGSDTYEYGVLKFSGRGLRSRNWRAEHRKIDLWSRNLRFNQESKCRWHFALFCRNTTVDWYTPT